MAKLETFEHIQSTLDNRNVPALHFLTVVMSTSVAQGHRRKVSLELSSMAPEPS